jgi:hypothetical protein
MSNLNYRNPKTPLTAVGGLSLPLEKTDGITFSVLNSGGYMEVYSLNDLIFQIPTNTIGPVLFSGNTIPVQLNKGSGTVFSPDVLTLSSDNITSGRRRLGMLVFVQEEKQVYQFRIDNYDTLWSAATGSTGPGGSTIVFSQFGTTVKNNTVAGQNLINAWTGSTIEGFNGGTRNNSNWIKYYGNDLAITGGTFSNVTNELTLTNITGGTIPITGFTSFDRAISAFTYDNANTFMIDDNSGNTYTATINIMTGLTVNGDLNVTGDTSVNGLSATTISATTYQNLPIDPNTFTTGFTYTPNTFTLFDNSGNTYSATIDIVSGLTINGNFVVTGNTNVDGLTATTISATTYQNLPIDPDTFITGFTYSPNTLTLSDNSGTTFEATIDIVSGLTVNGNLNVTGTTSSSLFSGVTFSGGTFVGDGSGIFGAPYLPISGGTVTGSTQITNGLTANTISAATYQNLPATFDRFVTGFTYSPNTFTIFDNSGTTFDATINTMSGLTINGNLSVTGNTNVNGLSATTISATTYQNLPATFDRFVTGFTYSPNTFTIFDNSGTTFDATIDIVSGLTVNGNLSVTGNTNVNGLSATTISATTYQNLPATFDRFVTGFTYSPNTFTIFDNSGTTFDATIDIVSGLTVNGNLSVTGNTNVNGLSATTISATTYQNLPATFDRFVTGFTYSPNTFTIFDNSGTTFDATIDIVSGLTVNGNLSVTGNTNVNGLSATTISATTYQNLPATFDRFVTGFTYSPNTFTIFDNSGTTFDATIDIVSGLTVNGNLSVTGISSSNIFSGNTFSGGTYYGDGSNLTGISGGSSTQFFYQSTAPTGTISPGSFWFNSTNGDLLVYIDDGNSQQWVTPSGPVIFERRSDFQSPYLYCGEAPQGTSESTPIWNIDRITINIDGTTLTETATGAWDNRYSLTYT